MSRGPWTITVGAPDGRTFTLHHRKNFIPEEGHTMHDLIQLSRLIRLAEKWQRGEYMKLRGGMGRFDDEAIEVLREILLVNGPRVCGTRLGGDPDDKRCGRCLGCRAAHLVEQATP